MLALSAHFSNFGLSVMYLLCGIHPSQADSEVTAHCQVQPSKFASSPSHSSTLGFQAVEATLQTFAGSAGGAPVAEEGGDADSEGDEDDSHLEKMVSRVEPHVHSPNQWTDSTSP